MKTLRIEWASTPRLNADSDALRPFVCRPWRGATVLTHAYVADLPRQLGDVVRLMLALELIAFGSSARALRPYEAGAAGLLIRTLSGAVGLSCVCQRCFMPSERTFLDAIRFEPDDLANWCAYADWLQERGTDCGRRRGETIAANLAEPVTTEV